MSPTTEFMISRGYLMQKCEYLYLRGLISRYKNFLFNDYKLMEEIDNLHKQGDQIFKCK